MRRLLLFAASLVMLGLTTATAASFDVQAEDIASFTSDVSIPVPADPSTKYFLVLTGGVDWLSTDSDDLLPGDPLEATFEPGQWREWNTDPLTAGLALVGRHVDLQVFKNGGAGSVAASIYDCAAGATTGAADCPLRATLSAGSLTNGVHVLRLSAPTGNVTAGRQLRLRIENDGASGSFKIQWGKDEPTKDSNLLISDPVAP